MTISRNLSFLAEGVSSTGVLGETYGGTGQSSITTGDLLYGSASNTISKLAIGSTGTILRVVAGIPSWGTDYTGTVTSVAATVPSFLSISGSPITTSGTLAITLSGTALPTTSGGTGLTSLTAGYIPYGNGTSAFSSSANMTFDGSTLTTLNSAYTGTLTGGTGIVNLGSGQFYKDASGNVGIGTSSPPTFSNYVTVGLNATTGSILNLAASGTSYGRFQASSSEVGLYQLTANPLVFYTSNTERMRITSTGNVGIGTSSPSFPLDVGNGTAQTTFRINGIGSANLGPYLRFDKASVQKNLIGSYSAIISGTSDDLAYWSTTGAGHQWIVNSNGSSSMNLNSSGNLGLGVTPSSSLTGWKSVEVAGIGQQWIVKNDSTDWHLTNNAYYNGGWKRGVSGLATDYEQNAGIHYWYNAPSSTAGSAITWTQAMTLDNSNNLLVGTTTTPTSVTNALVVNNSFYYGKAISLAAGASITIPVKTFTYGVGNLTVGGVVGGGATSTNGFYLLRWPSTVTTIAAAVNITVTCNDGISGSPSVTITNNTLTSFDGSVIINTCS